MKQFFIRYLLFLAFLFLAFYAPTSVVSDTLNSLQTQLTLFLLDPLLEPNQLQGADIWVHENYKIVISKACNGMIPILYLIGSVMAYPSTWRHKISWILMGYVVFNVVNVVRILFVVYITGVGDGHEEFYWSHDIVGNVMIMVAGLFMFVSFIKTSSKTVKNL